MFEHELMLWVGVVIYVIWVAIWVVIASKLDSEKILNGSMVAGVFVAVIGAMLLCPDNRSCTEQVLDELKKSNMELNDTIKIDSGTVFKYDDQYYLRASKDKVVKLDNVSAREAYESLK